MDEDAVDMECDDGGSGAGSSNGRLAAQALWGGVDALEGRVTSETSARLATLVGEPVGVKKRKTNRGTKGQKYRMTGDQKAAVRRHRATTATGAAGVACRSWAAPRAKQHALSHTSALARRIDKRPTSPSSIIEPHDRYERAPTRARAP